jgi:mRNA-degrading endonuclease RelE of RelBE toxin-antitoxin system
VVIVETSIFTRRVVRLLDDESYRLLQAELLQDPEKGALMRGSGGLRKLRWAVPGRGKRGGVRVIYYWAVSKDRFLMLLIYDKTEQDELTADQVRQLRQLVEREFK